MILDCFDVLMSKINLKIKNIIMIHLKKEKYFEKQ